MFATEQYISQKLKNRSKKAVFENGMGLATRKPVKMRFTYREFTLLLGVAVALIIAFTMILRKPSEDQSIDHQPVLSVPSILKPSEKAFPFKIITEVLLKK